MALQQSGDITYFIESHQLGVVSHIVEQINILADRRKRIVQVKRVTRIMKDLGLVPRDHDIIAVAIGCDCLGERGLFINCSPPVRQIVSLPQGEKNVA
jgi:hypothetical protein